MNRLSLNAGQICALLGGAILAVSNGRPFPALALQSYRDGPRGACASRQTKDVRLPQGAFDIQELPGGCEAIVSMGGDDLPDGGTLGLLDKGKGGPALIRTLKVPTPLVGLALTHDGRFAIAAGGDRIYVFDVGLLRRGRDAVVRTISYGKNPGTVSVLLARNERYLFASDEGSSTVTVFDFRRLLADRSSKAQPLASIAVDYAPTVLRRSLDDKYIYLTVEGVRRRFNPPILCRSEGGTDPAPVNQVGAVLVIDSAKAISDPEHAIVQRVFAGCSPVRSALSHDGRWLWVTNRLGDTVRSFETRKLIDDPDHAQKAVVQVGRKPIGVALLKGDILAVANSNRWNAGETVAGSITSFATDHGTNIGHVTKLTVGIFPRDLAPAPDGRTLYVSNYGSKSLSIIPTARLSQHR